MITNDPEPLAAVEYELQQFNTELHWVSVTCPVNKNGGSQDASQDANPVSWNRTSPAAGVSAKGIITVQQPTTGISQDKIIQFIALLSFC